MLRKLPRRLHRLFSLASKMFMGKAQGIIKLSNGQESGVGSDGGTVKLQTDLGVELEPERSLFAVTHRVPPMPVRKLSEIANSLHVSYLKHGQTIHETTTKERKLPIYRITSFSQMGNTG